MKKFFSKFINSIYFVFFQIILNILIIIFQIVLLAKHKTTIFIIINFLFLIYTMFLFVRELIINCFNFKIHKIKCFIITSCIPIILILEIYFLFKSIVWFYIINFIFIILISILYFYVANYFYWIYGNISDNYPSTKYTDQFPKNYYALDGTAVRSKSEVKIANYLYKQDIRYIYEYEITCSNGKTYYPDFILVDYFYNDKPVIIEYLGSSDIDYKTEQKNKHKIYNLKKDGYYVISLYASQYKNLEKIIYYKLSDFN